MVLWRVWLEWISGSVVQGVSFVMSFKCDFFFVRKCLNISYIALSFVNLEVTMEDSRNKMKLRKSPRDSSGLFLRSVNI